MPLTNIFCDCKKLCSMNCNAAKMINTIIDMTMFGGKNCFIKNACNCLGDAPSVMSKLISSLQDATVNSINNVKISKANNNINAPVNHEIFTTASTIWRYLLKRVLSASVVNPFCLR